MLCCVMLLIVGETKQLNEETPIRGPEIRRRGEWSVHTRQRGNRREIITMLLRDLLRLRLQTFNLNLNKHKQAFELLTAQKATAIGIQNIPDVLVSSVMLTI